LGEQLDTVPDREQQQQTDRERDDDRQDYRAEHNTECDLKNHGGLGSIAVPDGTIGQFAYFG